MSIKNPRIHCENRSKNPNEPEFLQAVKEVAVTVIPLL